MSESFLSTPECDGLLLSLLDQAESLSLEERGTREDPGSQFLLCPTSLSDLG